jgi:hypothetical protein
MTNFADLRTQLAQKRADKDASAASLAVLREQLRNLQQQIADLRRVTDPRERQRLAALEKQAAALTQEIDRQRKTVAGLKAGASDLLGQLTAFADPTKQIEQLNDAFPILLFPVRLETRFHQPESPGRIGVIAAVAAPAPQLWIRIYPDDCQVDSFEELLSATEVTNAREFWASMWRAGGVEAQERGAWRALVGGSGSGRAAYIIKQYIPDNLPDKPVKVDPQDVVLVIVPQIDLTPIQQTAAFTYFTAVWAADGDSQKEDDAFTALQTAVGNVLADDIKTKFAPETNGQDPPKPYTRAQVRVSCSVLKLPASPPTKTTAWTQAPKAFAMPDRFVAILYSGGIEVQRIVGNPVTDGLAVGPDPSLPPDEQIKKSGDDLVLNDDLLWMSDFERAVAVGMGIKVNLTAAQAANGFDRLVVLGLRFSSDEKDSKSQLETLIAHHYASKHGFSLVPQGSPTNNTESDSAAYTWADDADASYAVVFQGKDAYAESNDPLQRRDGQWLAEALGVDDALMKLIPNAAARDQGEARAMNIALWQATLGYAMEEMMTPLFSRADIALTRWFFTRYVSGRGPLPAMRVGRQPYGILPAMAFSRYRSRGDDRGIFLRQFAGGDYLQRLHALLTRLDADWRNMSAGVAHVGQTGKDAHQTLLDVVGLHSGSVEYHQRYAESFDQLYNKLVLELGQFWGGLVATWLKQRSQQILSQLGADPNAQPPILEKFFYGESALLNGPVVDDVPLSETKTIRGYTPDKKNYIEWLASASLDTIRKQDFGGNAAPTALLYLFLRHSMMLGHWDAGIRFLESHALVDSVVERREPAFVHVESASGAGQSKFKHLYSPRPEVTGSNTTTLAEYVLLPSVLQNAIETVDLREILGALDFLKDAPTARLERTFAEHIDCCTYRLDAWKTGITAARLEEMRAQGGEQGNTGIYLGAFAWLEDLRPNKTAPAPVALDAELAAVFQRANEAPLKHDPANAGYIHAPSLNHAATAAILKNAYRVNASPANPDAMAVNLSSDRVRRAMDILEGIRNGQTLPALLGYRFERGLHDEHTLAEVDKFIYPLRQAFPLVAKKLKNTKPDDKTDITLLEARNVIDGVKLITLIKNSGQKSYPFGLPMGPNPGQLPVASDPERLAINTEADALMNLYDAVADLVMAESVYQVVLGNFDRAAANTAAFSKGSRPPEVEVVNTPRNGITLTHRVTLHLDPNANSAVSPSAVPMTPRAKAEAPLNLWLAGRLPDPASVFVKVTYTTPVLPGPKTVKLSQADLKLQPIDLLYLINLDLDQAQSELDDRILQAVRYGADAHPDMAVTIEYTQPDGSNITLLAVAALVRSLRTLVLKSRVVGPTDMAMPLETKSEESLWDDAELKLRVNQAIFTLTNQRNALVTLAADGSDLDTYARMVSEAFLQTALSGIPQTGTGHVHGDIRTIYDAIATKIKEFVDRWDEKSAAYTALMAGYPALTTDEDRLALLQKAEGLIASSTTAPLPADPTVYKVSVDTLKGQFDTRLGQLKNLLKFAGNKLVDFAAAAGAMKPALAVHDAVPFDITDQTTAMPTLRDTLVARVTGLADELTKRIDDAQADVTATAALTSSEARVQMLQTAARSVLGDEMKMVPRFILSDTRGIEFSNCVAGSSALLTDLKAGGRRFPVDDWLYGLARVREKLNAWENVAILSEGFGSASADFSPVQLPLTADDRWLGLEFDPAKAVLNNRLLYTAHFAVPFDRTADQCALLLDEWPELVPGTEVTSGVTFHFDRPSSQPPQTMLLAVPAALNGRWNWNDLVETINETLDAAKARAVEPAQVDASPYAQFLPATLMAVTLYQIQIATNLALNNHIYEMIRS